MPAEVSPPTWDRTSRGWDMEADGGPTIEEEIRRMWPPTETAKDC